MILVILLDPLFDSIESSGIGSVHLLRRHLLLRYSLIHEVLQIRNSLDVEFRSRTRLRELDDLPIQLVEFCKIPHQPGALPENLLTLLTG
jgi:hypothetical protein